MRNLMLILLIFLIACNKKTDDYFRAESRTQIKQLIDTFERIQSLDDFKELQPDLRSQLMELAELMIEIRKYQLMSGRTWKIEVDDLALSDQLLLEMNRVLRIDGAKEMLQMCQREALLTLDSFQKKQ